MSEEMSVAQADELVCQVCDLKEQIEEKERLVMKPLKEQYEKLKLELIDFLDKHRKSHYDANYTNGLGRVTVKEEMYWAFPRDPGAKRAFIEYYGSDDYIDQSTIHSKTFNAICKGIMDEQVKKQNILFRWEDHGIGSPSTRKTLSVSIKRR